MAGDIEERNESQIIVDPKIKERKKYTDMGMSSSAADLRAGIDTAETPKIDGNIAKAAPLSKTPIPPAALKGADLGGWPGKGTSEDELEPNRPDYDNLGPSYRDKNYNPIDPKNLGPSWRERHDLYDRQVPYSLRRTKRGTRSRPSGS